MFAETGEKKPPHEAMKTMNRFWFFVKTEWTGPAVETVARPCPWAEGSPSWAVWALSRSPSLDDLWPVSFKALSLGSFLEWRSSEMLGTETSLLRLPLGGLEVALSEGLASVSFITTQLLVHLERTADVFAGPSTGRHHDLRSASRLRSEHRIQLHDGQSPVWLRQRPRQACR
jgi:hypothetical protein